MQETSYETRSYGGGDLFKGMVAGAVAGLVGTMVMTAFQQRIQEELKRPVGGGSGGGGESRQPWQREQSQGERSQSEFDQHRAGGLEHTDESEDFIQGQPEQHPPHHEHGGQSQQQPEPATAKAATRVARTLFGRELNEQQKQTGSEVAHYGFGTTMGMLYGAGVEYVPALSSATGMVYGTGLFLAADEVAVPALRLSPPPSEHPISTHQAAWASHLVYGVTVEVVRRVVRRVLC